MTRFVMYPEQGMLWELLHDEITTEHLGLIPSFLTAGDKRPAADQINERYSFGGGWHAFGKGKWTLEPDGTLVYYEPGLDSDELQDPPLKPLARTSLRNEVIYFYDHAIVAIVQPDSSFEVARID